MLKTIEGVYANGRIDLNETPADVTQSRVLVTFIPDRQSEGISLRQMQPGALVEPGRPLSTEEGLNSVKWNDRWEPHNGD